MVHIEKGSRRAFGIGEVAQMFGVSVDAVKRLAKAGTLRTFMLGGRRLVPVAEIERIEAKGLPLRGTARS